jgi:UDP-N-acetylglucosamine 2-epimerase (non-hydrolysing)
MREVLKTHQPDVLLVHGDTTTSLASAISGFYAGISVGHIEAGLRTHDIFTPFPEEFNRQVVGKVANWHFSPTTLSRQNLLNEGVPESRIVVTGNTVIDALHWVLDRIESDAIRQASISKFLEDRLPFFWQHQRFVLITGHRRENFGDGFMQICEALKELAFNFPEIHFVYPVHLNPNVQGPVNSILMGLSNVHLIDPLDYEPFVYLLKQCYLVLTDSGGIQEEAPSLGKPVLVMRDITERPEAVDAGTVKLVGVESKKIIAEALRLLDDAREYGRMSLANNPYGDGKAAMRISKILSELKIK